MKKSLLALAVLGAFAGAASAQSSVTLYGLVDVNLGKDIGSAAKRMAQGASSRLGFRGAEDLGGGTSAIFQLEHRFRPWNGTINGGNGVNGSPVTFWQARSYVGLQGGFGNVRLGREYDGAFFHSEVVADPWGWDTVVSSMTVGVTSGSASANFNVNRAVTYNSPNMGGFTFSGQIAESNDNCGASGIANGGATFGVCVKRPYSFGASYAAGPLSVGFGYNNPGTDNPAVAGNQSVDRFMGLRASYDLGVVKLWGFLGDGKSATNAKVKSNLLAVTAPLGQAELRAAIMNRKVGANKDITGIGIGYFYALSKRTTLYTDFARNGKAATEKTAYDFGIRHSF